MTQAAHILPFSLMSADTDTTVRNGLFRSCTPIYITIQLFKKCTVWSVIKSFTNIEFKELNGENINSLVNVITLDTPVHGFFGSLDIWLEAVPVCCMLLTNMPQSIPCCSLRVGPTLTKLRSLMILIFVVREGAFVSYAT